MLVLKFPVCCIYLSNSIVINNYPRITKLVITIMTSHCGRAIRGHIIFMGWFYRGDYALWAYTIIFDGYGWQFSLINCKLVIVSEGPRSNHLLYGLWSIRSGVELIDRCQFYWYYWHYYFWLCCLVFILFTIMIIILSACRCFESFQMSEYSITFWKTSAWYSRVWR